MSILSKLLPSGGGGAIVDFVASGTLPNGAPVILKADGTVEAVNTNAPISITTGAETVFNGQIQSISVASDPNTTGKFVVAYRDVDNSNFGTAAVGTVSGTTISFGAEYIFNSDNTQQISVAFDPNTAGKFVVAYADHGNFGKGTAIVGTVSGTTISLGAEYIFNSSYTYDISVAFDPNTAGSFVATYRDGGNSDYGTAVVGTLSGTTISFSAEYVFNSTATQNTSASFDPNTTGKFVVAYQDDAYGSGYGKTVVGTVSGTTLSFGTRYTFNSGATFYISLIFDPNTAGKFVVVYLDQSNSNYGTNIVGTVSGTAISFGTEYVFNSGATGYISASFDPNTANNFVVTYRDGGNSNFGTAIVGTVSGTTISFSADHVFNSDVSDYNSVAFDPYNARKFVVAYKDSGNSGYGTATVGQIATTGPTNLTASNFIGTSTKAYTNAEEATIALRGGVSTNQTGLTIGSTYYVQEDGTFATTADSISVNAGKALSATTLLLKDL